MTLSPQPVTSVVLTNIQEQLLHLWDAERGKKRSRASLFTLILYTQKGAREESYRQLIKSVIGRLPCRAILIIHEENPTMDSLKTAVSSETLGNGEGEIFCETIEIEVSGALVERVPSLILPHLLADLPIYLLWGQDPARDNAILPHLESFAERLILDVPMPDLLSYPHAVVSLMRRAHCTVGDVHWSAFTGWRTLFSQIFCDQEAFGRLQEAHLIHIHYAACNKTATIRGKIAPPPMSVIYFQAWLASRLRWAFKALTPKENEILITYNSPTQPVSFVLLPQERPEEPLDTVLAIEMACGANSYKGHYHFKKQPLHPQIYIQYSDRERCDLPYSRYLNSLSLGQEVLEEIFHPSGGLPYQETLEWLEATALEKLL